MTLVCDGPDPDLGIALRLSGYLDCQARMLGENGFQALSGGTMAAALLSGLITIFIALIGYRFILGGVPGLRDGVSWAVRLGFVLALVTSWPAYQTLVYRVAADAPGELAAVLLPAAGLPSTDLDIRIQQAYDTIRLGSTTEQSVSVPQPQGTQAGQAGQPQQQLQQPAIPGAQPPMPQTASALILSTTGFIAALRLVIGFLLAIGPIAVMSLLFDATLGILSGWVRSLVGSALALLSATIVTSVDLVMIESELARIQSYNAGGIALVVDPQAITTLVLVFALASVVSVLMAMRVASAFRMPVLQSPAIVDRGPRASQPEVVGPRSGNERAGLTARDAGVALPSRVSTIADTLATTVRREQGALMSSRSETSSSRVDVLNRSPAGDATPAVLPIGAVGRRSVARRSRSTARRDGRP